MATLGWNIKTASKKQNTNYIGTIGKHSNSPSDKQTRRSPHKYKDILKKKQTKALHTTPPEGKQTSNTHAQGDNASLQELSDSFWVNWNKGEKCQIYDLLVTLCQHNDFFKMTKQRHGISK